MLNLPEPTQPFRIFLSFFFQNNLGFTQCFFWIFSFFLPFKTPQSSLNVLNFSFFLLKHPAVHSMFWIFSFFQNTPRFTQYFRIFFLFKTPRGSLNFLDFLFSFKTPRGSLNIFRFSFFFKHPTVHSKVFRFLFFSNTPRFTQYFSDFLFFLFKTPRGSINIFSTPPKTQYVQRSTQCSGLSAKLSQCPDLLPALSQSGKRSLHSTYLPQTQQQPIFPMQNSDRYNLFASQWSRCPKVSILCPNLSAKLSQCPDLSPDSKAVWKGGPIAQLT